MKVLITCVGMNDPFNQKGGEGPILSFFDLIRRINIYRKYRPNEIFLLSTQDRPDVSSATQKKGEETKEELKKRSWGKVYNKSLDISDPTDYEQLLPAMKEAITKIIKMHGENAQYIINVSPGTGQMEAVWFALANSGLIKATFFQVKPPGVKKKGQKRIRKINIEPLFESDLIRIGINHFSGFQFESASKVFEDLSRRTVFPERASKASFFRELCRAYHNWSVFRYEEAKRIIDDCLRGFSFIPNQIRKLLQAQSAQLNLLSRDPISPMERAIDLYHAAYLQFEAGNYADSIWRSAASYEAVIVYKACDVIESIIQIQINPEHYGQILSQNSKNNSQVQNFILNFHGGRIPWFLGPGVAAGVLQRDRLASNQSVRRLLDKGRKLCDLRNRMLHQTQPVTRENAQEGLEVARQAIIQFGQNIQNRLESDYPFAKESLEEIKSYMEKL